MDKRSLREAARRGAEAGQTTGPGRRPGQKPPPPPVVAYEDVTAACGHVEQFGLFADARDKFRDARREKAAGRPCTACRERRQREEQEAAESRRARKAERAAAQAPTRKARGPAAVRLPDGSTFQVRYDASTETWSGTLAVGEATFTASASGVFKLLEKLDRLYRVTLPEQPAGEAAGA
jgi:hypothetical protein